MALNGMHEIGHNVGLCSDKYFETYEFDTPRCHNPEFDETKIKYYDFIFHCLFLLWLWVK